MDLTTIVTSQLRGALGLFRLDLEALPESAYTHEFNMVTRTVCDIVYEVNLVNDHVGMTIRGEEPFAWPDVRFIRAPRDFDTKSIALSAFDESAEKILRTVASFSFKQLSETIMIESGETTRYERVQFMTNHVWFHSGQLNFIQTLLGDGEWHWK